MVGKEFNMGRNMQIARYEDYTIVQRGRATPVYEIYALGEDDRLSFKQRFFIASFIDIDEAEAFIGV